MIQSAQPFGHYLRAAAFAMYPLLYRDRSRFDRDGGIFGTLDSCYR